MSFAIVLRAHQIPSLTALTKDERRTASPDLYWFHEESRFCYQDGPLTLYETREEAEGGILWIIALKGTHYMGDELEIEEIHDRVDDRVGRAGRAVRSL